MLQFIKFSVDLQSYNYVIMEIFTYIIHYTHTFTLNLENRSIRLYPFIRMNKHKEFLNKKRAFITILKIISMNSFLNDIMISFMRIKYFSFEILRIVSECSNISKFDLEYMFSGKAILCRIRFWDMFDYSKTTLMGQRK